MKITTQNLIIESYDSEEIKTILDEILNEGTSFQSKEALSQGNSDGQTTFEEESAEREKCVQFLLDNGFDLEFVNKFTSNNWPPADMK